MRYVAQVGTKEFSVEVVRRGRNRYAVRLDGAPRQVETRGHGAIVVLSIDGGAVEATVAPEGGMRPESRAERAYGVTLGGRHYPVRIVDPLRRSVSSSALHQSGRVEVRATMPGKVTALLVQNGQEIRAGQGLVVVEAMKMENEIPAPKEGRVTKVKVRAGDAVEAGALLLSVE